MNHFPISLAVHNRNIALVGGGDVAVAKLRLILKTEARIVVFALEAAPQILAWHDEGRLEIIGRYPVAADLAGVALLYAAEDSPRLDAATRALGSSTGVLTNVVDNLAASDFLTPAIVDRDPVTVAIGTEGAAPVLARAIKADLEARLSPRLGLLARIGKLFRPRAEALPQGRARRAFWADYYFAKGPRAAEAGDDLDDVLNALLNDHLAQHPQPGHVDIVSAGPGDPELLTLKARKALHAADVVIHDGLVAPEILELARREAEIIAVGKTGFGTHTPQGHINTLMVKHASKGAHVVRLKSGDATVFGRLDEELEALDAAHIAWSIVPGITAASAAVAQIGQSFTRRGRNSAARLVTGHDVAGYAEQDWRALAKPGEVAAIYMGKRSARFIQGRLLMHGADPATPVTLVENASRADGATISTTLQALPEAVAPLTGPAVILLGLAPRRAAQPNIQPKELAQ